MLADTMQWFFLNLRIVILHCSSAKWVRVVRHKIYLDKPRTAQYRSPLMSLP